MDALHDATAETCFCSHCKDELVYGWCHFWSLLKNTLPGWAEEWERDWDLQYLHEAIVLYPEDNDIWVDLCRFCRSTTSRLGAKTLYQSSVVKVLSGHIIRLERFTVSARLVGRALADEVVLGYFEEIGEASLGRSCIALILRRALGALP